MERIDVAINMEATGANIGRLMKACGYTVEEIRIITGLGSKQAVYRWLRGETIPGTENQAILSRVFGVEMNELLVFEGEGFALCGRLNNGLNDWRNPLKYNSCRLKKCA